MEKKSYTKEQLENRIKECINKGDFIEVNFNFSDGEKIKAIINEDGFQIENVFGTVRLAAQMKEKERITN